METPFVMECVEEEPEPVPVPMQHEIELEVDDELNSSFPPDGSIEQAEQQRIKLSAMDSFEVALSEEVRKYKHLYNFSMKENRDSGSVNSAWTEIAETLNSDATYCKKRWQNLRDKFTKARRRKIMGKRPCGRNTVPVLYSVLHWLDSHIRTRSMKLTIAEAAELALEQEQQPSPSCQPISRSPSTDLELELSTVNTDEFDCNVLDPPSPAPSPAPTPAPSIPISAPPPPPAPLHPPPTPTPAASSHPVPSPLPVPSLSATDVPGASCPVPSTASCPGPSTPSYPDPSADRSAPRVRKRKRNSDSEGLDYQSLFAALDQRRAEREAAMQAGRERRTAVIERLLERDECDRYVLHVADFMRSLPPDHLSEFKFKLQNLMRETEQAVKNQVVENGFTAVKGTGHQNREER